jgi:hypothetical protein
MISRTSPACGCFVPVRVTVIGLVPVTMLVVGVPPRIAMPLVAVLAAGRSRRDLRVATDSRLGFGELRRTATAYPQG